MKTYIRFIALLLILPATAFAQQAYPNPETAADAFTDALARSDEVAMQAVLGKDWRRFVPAGEIDRDDINRFLSAWAKKHHIQSPAPDRAVLAVGEEDWTLPIPILKSAQGWRFDLAAGADEMRTRRIGRNELSAMQAVLAYYDAQKDYARADRDGDSVLQYAQQFFSSPGKRNGLYWPTKAGEAQSPLGPLFAGKDLKPGEGYHGYRYKILSAQGKDAHGGAFDYLIKGRMTGGFAIVAWPIRYGDTGVMSFLLNHDGEIYEKDLGENSAAIAGGMTRFNPDAGWKKTAEPAKTALLNR